MQRRHRLVLVGVRAAGGGGVSAETQLPGVGSGLSSEL